MANQNMTEAELRELKTQSAHAGREFCGVRPSWDEEDIMNIKGRLRRFAIPRNCKPETFGIELEGFTCRVSAKHDHPSGSYYDSYEPGSEDCVWYALQAHLEETTGTDCVVHRGPDDLKQDKRARYEQWVIIQDASIFYTFKEATKLLPTPWSLYRKQWKVSDSLRSMLLNPEFPDKVLEHTDVELNSPVLDLVNLEDSIGKISLVVDQIRNSPEFFTGYNRTCGMHVHIGCGLKRTFPLAMLKRIAMVCVVCEYAMNQLFTWDRYKYGSYNSSSRLRLNFGLEKHENGEMTWTPMTVAEICETILAYKSTIDLLSGVFGSIISFRNIDQKGTVEFRGHEMTLDMDAITMWVCLLSAMVSTISKSTTQEVVKKLVDPFGNGWAYQWPVDIETDYEDGKLRGHNSLIQFLKHFVGIQEITDYYKLKAEKTYAEETRKAAEDKELRKLKKIVRTGDLDASVGTWSVASTPTKDSNTTVSIMKQIEVWREKVEEMKEEAEKTETSSSVWKPKPGIIKRYTKLWKGQQTAAEPDTPQVIPGGPVDAEPKDSDDEFDTDQPITESAGKTSKPTDNPTIPRASTPSGPRPVAGQYTYASRGTNPLPDFNAPETNALVREMFGSLVPSEATAFLDEIGMPPSELYEDPESFPAKKRRTNAPK